MEMYYNLPGHDIGPFGYQETKKPDNDLKNKINQSLVKMKKFL